MGYVLSLVLLMMTVGSPSVTVGVERFRGQWRSQGGARGAMAPPQTFGKCFFSAMN